MSAYKILKPKEKLEPDPIAKKNDRLKTEILVLTFVGFILIMFGSFLITTGVILMHLDNNALCFYTGICLILIGLLLTLIFVKSKSYFKLVGSVYCFYITIRAWLTIDFVDKISIVVNNVNLAAEEAGISNDINQLYSPIGLRPVLIFLFIFSLCLGIILCIMFIYEHIKNRRKMEELELKVSHLSEELKVIQNDIDRKGN